MSQRLWQARRAGQIIAKDLRPGSYHGNSDRQRPRPGPPDPDRTDSGGPLQAGGSPRRAHRAGTGHQSGSVREALRELEASRLVESEPRRGTRVRVMSLKELQDAYFARGILERAAAATAAKAFKGNVEKLRQEVPGNSGCGRGQGSRRTSRPCLCASPDDCGSFRERRPPPALGIPGIRDAARVRLAGSAIDMEQFKASYEAILADWKRATPGRAARRCRNTPRRSRPTMG